MYCILLEHQSFRTISPILAQFSAFWKEQRADCTNTRLTDTQTPRQTPPDQPSTPPPHRTHPCTDTTDRSVRAVRTGRQRAPVHVSLVFFLFFFFSFPPFISSLPLSASSVGRPRLFPFPPQVPFVYHSNGIKLGEVITAY